MGGFKVEETIIQIINSVGFPIAVSIALFWQNNKNQEQYLKTFNEFQKVIESNNDMLDKLTKEIQTISSRG